MLNGDVAEPGRLLGDAAVYTDQSGLRIGKMEDLTAHRSGLLRID